MTTPSFFDVSDRDMNFSSPACMAMVLINRTNSLGPNVEFSNYQSRAIASFPNSQPPPTQQDMPATLVSILFGCFKYNLPMNLAQYVSIHPSI